MSKQIIDDAPGAVPSLRTFSQAVVSNGIVYLSGSIGTDVEHNIIGGVKQQATSALDNMKLILEGAGSGLEHIIKVNVYLSNLARDFDTFNEIYLEFFSGLKDLPARTCVGVAALPFGAFVEVECIAKLA